MTVFAIQTSTWPFSAPQVTDVNAIPNPRHGDIVAHVMLEQESQPGQPPTGNVAQSDIKAFTSGGGWVSLLPVAEASTVRFETKKLTNGVIGINTNVDDLEFDNLDPEKFYVVRFRYALRAKSGGAGVDVKYYTPNGDDTTIASPYVSTQSEVVVPNDSDLEITSLTAVESTEISAPFTGAERVTFTTFGFGDGDELSGNPQGVFNTFATIYEYLPGSFLEGLTEGEVEAKNQ
ncbi:MAG: hypothetical protein AAFU85_20820 [Planctomycetota bacterium]